jgi:hypothetical protein
LSRRSWDAREGTLFFVEKIVESLAEKGELVVT